MNPSQPVADECTAISALWLAVEHGFALPSTWNPPDWRRAIVVGSGLSALAARTVLADAGLPVYVPSDEGQLRRRLKRSGARLIGVSLSGTSAEVIDALSMASEMGRPNAMLTASGEPSGLRLPPLPGPKALRHLAICNALSKAMGLPAAHPRPTFISDIEPMLARSVNQQLIPYVFAPRGSFMATALTAYWREFLHRPASRLIHPDWTHDFLWAFARSPVPGAHFLGIEPKRDLSDRRFSRVVSWLQRHEYSADVLSAAEDHVSPTRVQRLCDVAATFHRVARTLGRDLETEVGFDEVAACADE